MWKKINRDDVPETLYHYCSVDTFMKIIENKTIRLSNIFKMNDWSEVIHVLNLLPSRLHKKYQTYGADSPFPRYKGKDGSEIFDELISDIRKQIEEVKYLMFIACFSKCEDDLGQWRAYADDGRGVAIGFDGRALCDIARCCRLQLTDVCYCITKHKEYVDRTMVPRIFDALKNAATHPNVKSGVCPYETMVQIMINADMSAVLIGAAQYKDKAYENEQEWRLCLGTAVNQTWYESCEGFAQPKKCGNLVLGRMSFSKRSGNRISSYFDLYFGGGVPGMIKKIIMGPRSMSQDDIDLKMLLKINGFNLGQGAIRRSEISYIGMSE